MRYALIGCGRIATNHMKAALNNQLEIVAVCDILPSKMEELLSKHDLEKDAAIKRYTDYKEMIQELDPELISIATESGIHAEIALHCIDHGVNVIIEKPMAMSMEDADEIIRRSKEKGVKVSACHQNRFNIAIQELRKAIESGRFGKLSHGTIHVRWNRGPQYYEQASWRGTWEQDGGALMNQCIHGIDLLRWMMGDEIEESYGVTRLARLKGLRMYTRRTWKKLSISLVKKELSKSEVLRRIILMYGISRMKQIWMRKIKDSRNRLVMYMEMGIRACLRI